ncbi:MAG: hypothetical protein DRO05_00170 [Thermoproteota archaeon]|nr:MAG: hypothetical protein DRO05_00170 [Candidatus Korarchaeota archaeon]
MSLGYIILFVLYTAIALFPFVLGFLEYEKPADPGPLYINLDRIVSDRKEALTFRELIEPAIEIGLLAKDVEDLSPETVLRQKPKFHPELGYFRLIYGDAEIPSNTVIEDLLIVIGNLRIGDRCKMLGGVYATGEVRVGSDCTINFIASDSNVFLGRNTSVERWVDAKGTIVITKDCRVRKATSEHQIEVVECCEMREACANMGLEVLDSSELVQRGSKG